MKKTAIILAAGSGTRAGGKLPKQLQLLDGKPVFAHSIEKFLQNDPETEIILVINEAYKDMFVAQMRKIYEHTPFKYHIVRGGDSRASSVLNAIAILDDTVKDALIAVHDAARPLVSSGLLSRGWQTAERTGAAVPAIPLTDSIRHLEPEGKSITVTRKDFVAVQTPQVFHSSMLLHAYDILRTGSIDAERITDDASVVEAAGYEVTLYEGDNDNMKITGPFDLQIAALILNSRRKN